MTENSSSIGDMSLDEFEYSKRTANILAGLFASHGEKLHRYIMVDRPGSEQEPYEGSAVFQLGQKLARIAVQNENELTVRAELDPIESFWIGRMIDFGNLDDRDSLILELHQARLKALKKD